LAWEALEPVYLQKLKDLVKKFEQAKANNSGSDNVKEVVEAAEAGRVDTILIEKDRVIAERLRNKNTGTFKQADSTQPILDDLLDDIGELVTKMGGKVMFIPSEIMPTKTGLAAVFRY
jgi:peptide subunit release factor 1 (eRF1)